MAPRSGLAIIELPEAGDTSVWIDDHLGPTYRLTRLQALVLKHLADGLSVDDIAARLGTKVEVIASFPQIDTVASRRTGCGGLARRTSRTSTSGGTFRFNVERYADVLVERAAERGSTKHGR